MSHSRGRILSTSSQGCESYPCASRDLEQAWKYFERPDLHRLSAVDALSFVLMTQRRIRIAFAFDGHFAAAGFRLVG